MNIKKALAVAAATATLAASVTAVTVNASVLGQSSDFAEFVVTGGELLPFDLAAIMLDGGVNNQLAVIAVIEPDSLAPGKYRFNAELTADKAIEEMVNDAVHENYGWDFDCSSLDILNITITKEDGTLAELNGSIKLMIANEKGYAFDDVYELTNSQLVKADYTTENGTVVMTTNNLGKIALTMVRSNEASVDDSDVDLSIAPPPTDKDLSVPSTDLNPNNNPVNTGDSTPVFVVAGVTLAALSAAVVISKRKKAE